MSHRYRLSLPYRGDNFGTSSGEAASLSIRSPRTRSRTRPRRIQERAVLKFLLKHASPLAAPVNMQARLQKGGRLAFH